MEEIICVNTLTKELPKIDVGLQPVDGGKAASVIVSRNELGS